jgi:hypothetical protein
VPDPGQGGLDAATPRGDVLGAMNLPPALRRPLLEQLPAPARRVAGITVLSLTLWMAAFLALWR